MKSAIRSITFATTLLAVLLSGPTRAEAGTGHASLEGQVVCSQCWFEADRSKVAYGNPGDLDCARRCADAGVPPAMAVRDADGGFELYLLQGAAAGHESWLELTGRFVRVAGAVGAEADRKTVEVAELEVLEQNPWPEPETNPAGSPVVGSLAWSDLSGHAMPLESLRGRVVVLNFWSTSCAPCVKEMPDLVRVQNRYGVFGVQVLGAGTDTLEQKDAVLRFARAKKLNFPIVLGAETHQMESLGLVPVLPATVVFDREGRVVERFAGVFERSKLEAAIERALEGPDHHDDHDHHAAAGKDRHVHITTGAGATEASLVPS